MLAINQQKRAISEWYNTQNQKILYMTIHKLNCINNIDLTVCKIMLIISLIIFKLCFYQSRQRICACKFSGGLYSDRLNI